jgi:protein-export membrane protein SecD
MDAGILPLIIGAVSLIVLIVLYGVLGWKSKIYRLIVILFVLAITAVWIYPTIEWYFIYDESTRNLVNIPQTSEEDVNIEGAKLQSINSYTREIRKHIRIMKDLLGENSFYHRYPQVNKVEDEKRKPAILDIRTSNIMGASLSINDYILDIDRETFIKRLLPGTKVAKEEYYTVADEFFRELETAKSYRDELNKILELKEKKKKTINLGLDLAGGISFTLDVDEESLRNDAYTQYNHMLDEEAIRASDEMKQFVENLEASYIKDIRETYGESVRMEIEQNILDETDITDTESEQFAIELENRLDAKAKAEIDESSMYQSRIEEKIAEEVLRIKADGEQQINDYVAFVKEQTKKDALDILKKRVNQFGVSEPEIGKTLGDRPLVQLAGADDPASARKMVTQAGKLEFRLVDGELMDKISTKSYVRTSRERLLIPQPTAESLYDMLRKSNPDIPFEYLPGADKVLVRSESGNPEDDSYAFMQAHINDFGERIDEGWMFLKNKVEMEGTMILDARARMGSQQTGINDPYVSFELTDEGTDIFAEVTGNNIGKNLAILLDGYIQSAPNIGTKIIGSGSITGQFTVQAVQELVSILKSGSISSKLQIVSENIIGPKLGAENIQNGIFATLIGLGLVVIFMLVYYRMGGLFANIALILNLFLLVSILSLMHFTLTLPGIAGILLTIGMAVDANVLIFERIKEEIKNGKSILAAVDEGYSKAFRTIFDANLTTILAAVVLSQVGTGVLKGFGVTLAVGIASSMFTALVISKLLIDTFVSITKGKKLWI